MVIKAKKCMNNNNNVEASEKFAHLCGGNIKSSDKEQSVKNIEGAASQPSSACVDSDESVLDFIFLAI